MDIWGEVSKNIKLVQISSGERDRCTIVHAKTGEEKLFRITKDPLPHQVEHVVQLFGLDHSRGRCDSGSDGESEGDHIFFLTLDSTPSTVISSLLELHEAATSSRCIGLWEGADLATATLDLLADDVQRTLSTIFQLVRCDPELADVFIELDVLGILAEVVVASAECDDPPAVVELAMATLCELTQYERGLDALRAGVEDGLICPSFFRRAVETIMAPATSGQTARAAVSSVQELILLRPAELAFPCNTLSGCLFLLQDIPSCAVTMHAGLCGDDAGSPLQSLYHTCACIAQ